MSLTDLERSNAFEESVKAAIRGTQAKLWTALPGQIASFNAERQTAEVQATIQAEVTAPDGSVTLETIPLLLDCPVQFPRGGGCVLTFPVAVGDECLVVFASRCIDAWWQNGGVQPQAELRMHDLSDGFVIVGFSSLTRLVENLSTVATELRALDGSTSVTLNPTAHTVAIKAPGGIMLDGPVTATSTIVATGDVTANGVSVKTHKHGGVTAGAAQTGVPV